MHHRVITTFWTLVVPLAVTGMSFQMVRFLRDDLPDPVATHWDSRGVPDGFAPVSQVLLLMVAVVVPLSLFWWSVGFFAGRAAATRRITAAVATFSAVAICGIVVGSLAIQRGLDDAADTGGIGLVIGVALAAVLALRAVARASGLHREALPPADEEVDADDELALLHERIAVYRIDGALFFADVRRFLDELAGVADVRVVVLRLSGVRILDTSGANALAEIVDDLQHRGIVVLLKGLRPEHRRLVETIGVLDRLSHEKHLFDDLGSAIEHARSHVRRSLVGAASPEA